MKSLIENGNLFIARPPLYKIKKGKDEMYLMDDTELQVSLIKFGIKEIKFKTAFGTTFQK